MSTPTKISHQGERRPTNKRHIRHASGKSEAECFCLAEKAGSGRGDVRLGCMCLVHYDCLVQYIRSQLGDKSSLFLSMSRDSMDGSGMSARSVESDFSKRKKGIVCPFYSPYGNMCRYRGFIDEGMASTSLDMWSESVDDNNLNIPGSFLKRNNGSNKYFMDMDDLQRVVEMGMMLENGKLVESTIFSSRSATPVSLNESDNDGLSTSGEPLNLPLTPSTVGSSVSRFPVTPVRSETSSNCHTPLSQEELDKLKTWIQEDEQSSVDRYLQRSFCSKSRQKTLSKSGTPSKFQRAQMLKAASFDEGNNCLVDSEYDDRDTKGDILAKDLFANMGLVKVDEDDDDDASPAGSNDYARENEDDLTSAYIVATTKPCPSCGFRATHYHGHGCHHISPNGGCPSCQTHYCYACECSAQENFEERGKESICQCGFWSSFCKPLNNEICFQEYLTTSPYPRDSRCGCPICPDCREHAPCALCTGDCDVCKGFISPGPQDLLRLNMDGNPEGRWQVQTDQMRHRLVKEPILQRLHSACSSGDLMVVKEALHDARQVNIDANSVDRTGKTSLHHVCMSGSDDANIVTYLVDRCDADINAKTLAGHVPLHLACSHGFLEVVRVLHDRGANLNALDDEQKSPIFYACFQGRINIIRLLLLELPDTEVVLDARDTLGWTALHYACYNGHTDIVRILAIDKQVACIDTPNNRGKTALHFAAEKNFADIVRLLVLECGANPNIEDMTKSTPLLYACDRMSTNAVRALLLDMQSLIKLDWINKQNCFGKTALHYACEKDSLDIAHILVGCRKAAVNVLNADGFSPLHFVCKSGSSKLVWFLVFTGQATLNLTDLYYTAVRMRIGLFLVLSAQMFISEFRIGGPVKMVFVTVTSLILANMLLTASY